MKNRLQKTLKNYPLLLSFIKNSYFLFRKYIYYFLFTLCRVFPVKKHKIIINSFYGSDFGDNGKYIVDELINANTDYLILWVLNEQYYKKHSLPEAVKPVKYKSLQYIYHMATSRIWIDNCRILTDVLKRKNQIYIQMWHGTLPLKKIEADAPTESLSSRYITKAKRDSQLADFIISNSSFFSTLYKNSFWYKGEIKNIGYPKNDLLFNNTDIYKVKIKDHFALASDAKIILYAPTFRKDLSLTAYNIDVSNLLNTLTTSTSDKWVFITRMHPNLKNISLKELFNSEVIDATTYPDLQELILGSDMLITDYSSCMFDAALAQKPTFIYASDIHHYSDERGFYFKLEELPFSIAKNTPQLIKNIQMFDIEQYEKKLSIFTKDIGFYDDGQATKRFHNFLNSILK